MCSVTQDPQILAAPDDEFAAYLLGMGRAAELLRRQGSANAARRVRCLMIALRAERKRKGEKKESAA